MDDDSTVAYGDNPDIDQERRGTNLWNFEGQGPSVRIVFTD